MLLQMSSLLLRAGYIRRAAPGGHTLLPLARCRSLPSECTARDTPETPTTASLVTPTNERALDDGAPDDGLEVAPALARELVGAGLRVLVDDRPNISAGVQFTDAELIGIPRTVVIGRRPAEGRCEPLAEVIAGVTGV